MNKDVSDLEHVLNKLDSHFKDTMWIDATDIAAVAIALYNQNNPSEVYVDYEAIGWALQKLHNFGVTQNNMENAMMADRLELMLKMAQASENN
jgi:hypothetical protein